MTDLTNLINGDNRDVCDDLTGEANVLWRTAHALLEARALPALDEELRNLQKALRPPERWSLFDAGQDRLRSRSQVLASIATLRAVVALRQGHEAPFRARIRAALRHLTRALPPQPEALRAAPRSRRPRPSFEGERKPAGEDERPGVIATTVLGALVAEHPTAIVPLAAIRSALAGLWASLATLCPAPDRTTRFPLLTFNLRAKVFDIVLTATPSLFGRWVISPELPALGATALDDVFLRSLERALALALAAVGLEAPARQRPLWLRWSLAGAQGIPLLKDGSGGGAFAAAILGLIQEVEIDPHIAFSASIDDDLRLAGVGEIKAKALAARARTPPVRALILHGDDHAAWVSTLAPPGFEVLPARSVSEALSILSRERAAVLDFLRRLARDEPALAEVRQFVPDATRTPGPLLEFLLPPRVWEEERGGAAPRRRDRAAHSLEERLSPDAGEEVRSVLSADAILDGLWNPAQKLRHVLVLGLAGAGKSTLLWRAFTRHAAEVLRRVAKGEALHANTERLLIPLGLPLGALPLGPDLNLLAEAIQHTLALAYPEYSRPQGNKASSEVEQRREVVRGWLEGKANAGEVVLYLDAFDELHPNPVDEDNPKIDTLRRALQGLAKPRILLTTRPTDKEGDLGLSQPLRLEMALLEMADVKMYVERSFPEPHGARRRSLLESLRQTPGPRALVRVPLFLALLCKYAPDTQLHGPGGRARLVKAALDTFLERAAAKVAATPEAPQAARDALRKRERPKLLQKLAEVAWDRYAAGLLEMDLGDLVEKLEEGVPDALIAAGLLLRRGKGTDNQDRVAIILRSIHEYLLAERLAKRYDALPKTRDAFIAFVRGPASGWTGTTWCQPQHVEAFGDEKPLTHAQWENVWPFVAGKLEGERAVWLLEALREEWRAAVPEAHESRAASTRGGRGGRTKRRSPRESQAYQTALDRALRLLGLLARCLAEVEVSSKAKDGLEKEAIEALVEHAEGNDDRLAATALEALIENGGPLATEALVRWVETSAGEDWGRLEVRCRAIDALAGSGNEAIVRAFRGVVLGRRDGARERAEPRDIRERCVAALGRRLLHHPTPDGSFEHEPLNQAAFEVMETRLKDAYEVLDDWVAPAEWQERGLPHTLPQYRHRETGVVFLLIPAGEFRMGSPPGARERFSNEEQHLVQLRPFLLARHAMPSAVYERFQDGKAGEPVPEKRQAGSLPQVRVSWEEAMAFCRRFGWTLPSEAQWEYACRAGTTTRFAFGDELSPEDANFGKGLQGRPCTVGEYRPNAFGLYQMHGNVWEWCRDVFSGTYYAREEARGPDPVCHLGSRCRVLRGGSYWYGAGRCRSASRGGSPAFDAGGDIGFRPSRPLL